MRGSTFSFGFSYGFSSAFLGLVILFSSACSTPLRVKSGYSANELFLAACGPGKTISSVQGHLWLKANSKEVSGQFPADVNATVPDHLKLEITNILGGTEALILVDGEHYEIRGGRGQKEKKDEGYGSWGGIPLRWATDLFLGKIPCPPMGKRFKLSSTADGDLVIETGGPEAVMAERFTYRFQENKGKPWPDFLLWERLGSSGLSIEFKFDNPENDTLSPTKWEAISKSGSVRVRWSNREVTQESTAATKN